MRFRIRHGFDIPLDDRKLGGEPVLTKTRRAALVGSDYQDCRLSVVLEEGDRVRAGETLCTDRRNPEIRIASPGSGVVREIRWSHHRRLEKIVIELNDEPPVSFDALDEASLPGLSSGQIRERLLEAGLWTAFRARPYERIPAPDIEPRAIFVTAIDTNPLAPDPFLAIAGQANDFRNGLTILSRLTNGMVHVCTAEDKSPLLPECENVSHARFSGPHPAGLPGTHIHALESVSEIQDLWHIGYQDVIAIGQQFHTGIAPQHRVVSVSGPRMRTPQLLRVQAGAELSSLMPEAGRSDSRVISGSILSGHVAPGFLGRYHNQVTVLPESLRQSQSSYSSWRTVAQMVRRGNCSRGGAASADLHGLPCGMLPLVEFDRIWPYRTPPAAMLRALLTGDAESAVELGCRGLAEEDLALCTYACVSKNDYGNALRRTLQEVERQGL